MSECTNIVTNSAISGLGVRLSLYLQTLITVIFIRLSPENATPSWWAMSTTSIGLAVASFVTGAQRSISLVDGIISSYLLVLPLTAAIYAEVRLIERKLAVSPLLVIAGFIRGALMSAFGLWIWGSSPTFGSIPECNDSINIFVFRQIRATSAPARGIGLAFWGACTLFLCFGNLQRYDTLIAAVKALFSKLEAAAFRLPRNNGPENKIAQSSGYIEFSLVISRIIQRLIPEWTRQPWSWSHQVAVERAPTRDFHAPGVMFSQNILDSSMGQVLQGLFFVPTVVVFVVILVLIELELTVGNKNIQQDLAFGFDQILPLSLTIVPVLSLLDWYSRPVNSQLSKLRSVRLTIKGMNGQMRRENGELRECFILVSIEQTNQLFTTLTAPPKDPRWNKSFDISVSVLSNVLIEIFDFIDGQATSCGYAVITPLYQYDLLKSEERIIQVPIRMKGHLDTHHLEVGLTLDPTEPAHDAYVTGTIRNRSGYSTRLTTYYAFDCPPSVPLFTAVYRLESVTEHFTLPGLNQASVLSSTAYVYWLSSLFGTICLERSPEKLPDRVRLGTGASLQPFSLKLADELKYTWLPGGNLVFPPTTGQEWIDAFIARFQPMRIFRSIGQNYMITFSSYGGGGGGLVKTEMVPAVQSV
ncbi:hypothetical protein B0H16DRAFT_1698723 [Mycena metata]|uniref:C2 domain-containing protein n=1 Tax=Mycena metata TaxID=1033252 RepID=A0AAD7HN60_9AGAR|nr:hypothetical protein B0H16DRAFT_1698723 [Mycena metata]